MPWGAVATGLYNLAIADTGTGGLFNVSSPLITGWYTGEALQNAEWPYVCCTLSADSENDVFAPAPQAIETFFQFGVYSNAELGQTVNDAIQARIRTVFRRVAPTVAGYTAFPIMFDGMVFNQRVDRVIYSAVQASVFVSSST